MVILLAEHADEPVDVGHTVKLVVVHDLVEIYAGDTPLYDDEGALDQEDRERAAADRLFGLLPADQAGDAVRARKAHIGAASAPLGATARLIIDEGERRGWVRSGEHTGGDRSAAPPA